MYVVWSLHRIATTKISISVVVRAGVVEFVHSTGNSLVAQQPILSPILPLRPTQRRKLGKECRGGPPHVPGEELLAVYPHLVRSCGLELAAAEEVEGAAMALYEEVDHHVRPVIDRWMAHLVAHSFRVDVENLYMNPAMEMVNNSFIHT